MINQFVRNALFLFWMLCLPWPVLADGVLSGKIIDAETGDGVRCQAWFFSGSCGQNYQGQVWSSDDGTYTKAGLPAGNVYIRLMPGNAGLTEYVNEYYNGASTCEQANAVIVGDDETLTLDLPLHHPSGGGSISGTVTDSSGTPISALKVYAYTGKCGAGYISYGVDYTEDDGTFFIANLPVGYIYVKACPRCTTGFEQADQWWTTDLSNTQDCYLAEPVVINQGSKHEDIDFILTSGGAVTGILTRPDGRPVMDSIVVHAYRASPCGGEYLGGGVAGFSGTPGEYVIDQLPAGDIYVRTDSFTRPADSNVQKYYDGNEGSIKCDDAIALKVGAGQTISGIDMTIPVGGDISGAVLYNGLPAGPARIYIYIGTASDGFWLTTEAAAYTKDDGSFLLRHVPDGSVSIIAYPKFGFAPVWWTGNNEPGTPHIDLATLVPVRSGEETLDIVFGLDSFNGDHDQDQDVDGEDLSECARIGVPNNILELFAAGFGKHDLK